MQKAKIKMQNEKCEAKIKNFDFCFVILSFDL